MAQLIDEMNWTILLVCAVSLTLQERDVLHR